MSATPNSGIRIVILTQDDPFFLAESLDYLFCILPPELKVTGCVLFGVSPFGSQESFRSRIYKTWRVFGTGFLLNYGSRFLVNKLRKSKQVTHILKKHKVPAVRLTENVNALPSIKKIKALEPDLLLSIAGNQLYKDELLKIAPEGCLNLHTALLPKYRGLMPSFWVLKNGEEETGVSVFFVNKDIDSGPIVVQKRIPVNKMTQRELIRVSKRIGMEAIVEAIQKIAQGEYEVLSNSDENSTYYSFPTRKDVQLFKQNGKRFY